MTEPARPLALVVDDEPDFAAFVAEVVETTGYAARAISDPREIGPALDSDPALLLLDLKMPGVDGIEVLRQLGARRSATRVVLMSGTDVSILDAARRLGAAYGLEIAGALSKPLRAEELKAVLARLPPPAARAREARGSSVTRAEMERALAGDELVVHFQPQVALADGACVGAEALVRWQHPGLGLLYPDSFIALAETAALAPQFTQRIIELALVSWSREATGIAGSLAINLPPSALDDLAFPEWMLGRCKAYGCRPDKLQFEVTETALPSDPRTALDILTRLRLKGLRLAIDDFGTGHSSLEQLHDLPFNELKIDVNFVRVALSDARARAIVERSIQLGRDLGLTVLAEGVESAALWHWLREAGCTLAQGYLISRPLPAGELARWLSGWQAPGQPAA